MISAQLLGGTRNPFRIPYCTTESHCDRIIIDRYSRRAWTARLVVSSK